MAKFDAGRRGKESVDARQHLPVASATRRIGTQPRVWAAVYQELISTQRELLNRLESSLAEIRSLAREDAAATDEIMLRAQIESFRQRLDFWQEYLIERRPHPAGLGLATPPNC